MYSLWYVVLFGGVADVVLFGGVADVVLFGGEAVLKVPRQDCLFPHYFVMRVRFLKVDMTYYLSK